ncbi:hypothetical protein PIB30_060279 [Stylosanthes scabra]|uniref:Uncharacterized protein n=1 Tax=Stylosanthes scabra TaxID=79078 RepID=A0ABU6TLE7_9FABA|nr:hypothetical protein [Stylosanthes scabra]
MANSKVVFMVSYILLALVIFNDGFSVIGRPLKTENNNDNNNVTEETVVWRRDTLDGATAQNLPPSADGVGKWTDDFRPTDPGPSPGAGHSSPHAKLVTKP